MFLDAFNYALHKRVHIHNLSSAGPTLRTAHLCRR